ncbi:MAG: hypothetical protein WB507_04915 [Solirubrobacterales bacterium]
MKQKLRARLTFANVMSCVAVFVALTGSAYAAISIPRNSVGTRQLQAKSVTNGKLANGAITGAKVAEGTLTGANINLTALGTVPTAALAAVASNANALEGHSASCPSNTTLIRGLCFDSTPNSEVPDVEIAAESCANKGGWLPTPLELYAVKNILDLGSGVGSHNQYTDTYYAEGGGSGYHTVVIDGEGHITQVEIAHSPEQYTCVYPLLR